VEANQDRPECVLVVAGGDPIDPALVGMLPPNPLVVAADSGLDQALRLGLEPSVVVGDMDSVSPIALARAVARGVTLERHPVDKEATDLELALRHVATGTWDSIIVLGGEGGRLDHLLANALLLAAEPFAALPIEWWTGSSVVTVAGARHPVRRRCAPDETVSLIAVGGPASGVTTSGLRWALEAATLPAGSTRGISNSTTAYRFTVSTTSGVLLVVHERMP
jgi:thiamine pyrophosphokinase